MGRPSSRISFKGDLLQELLNENGMDQGDIAKEIGVSRKTINEAINDNLINPEYLSKIASRFDCSVDYLRRGSHVDKSFLENVLVKLNYEEAQIMKKSRLSEEDKQDLADIDNTRIDINFALIKGKYDSNGNFIEPYSPLEYLHLEYVLKTFKTWVDMMINRECGVYKSMFNGKIESIRFPDIKDPDVLYAQLEWDMVKDLYRHLKEYGMVWLKEDNTDGKRNREE